MTEDELAELIKKGHYLKLGAEKGSTKVHLLFYSAIDAYWFVLVLDEATSEVITVLPVDYHNRWKISDDAKRQAYRLVAPIARRRESPQLKPAENAQEGQPTVYRFSAVVNEGGRRRTVNLGSVPLKSFGTLEEASSDPQVRETLRTRLLARGRPGAVYQCLIGQVGSKGEPVVIPIPAFP